MHADLADKAKRQLAIEPPVEFLLPCGVGGDAAPACFFVPLPLCQGVLAHRAGAHEVDQKMPLRIRARLQANLKIELERGLCRIGDRACVVDVMRHRRFAIDVFTGLERGKRDFPVQMRRRGDDDGLHVFVRKQLGVRRVSLGLGRATEAAPQISRICVTHGDHWCVGDCCQRLKQLPPPYATTDHADGDRRCVVVFRGVLHLANHLGG